MVNIELYRIFIAIYRAGTISKAAVLCDITQPAASQQLASLEKTLKVKLFERTPRAMVATNEGHELYTKVADSFDWLDFVSQDFMMKKQEEEILLRIGVPLSYYTQELIKRVDDLPFRLDVHFGNHEILSQDFINGKLDLIVSDTQIKTSHFYSEKLLTQKYFLVGNKDIIAPEEGFKYWQNIRAWVREQKWVSYDAELSLIRTCFKQQYDLQPNINPKFIIPNMHTMLMTLHQSSTVTILPEYMCIQAIKNKDIVLLHTFENIYDSGLYMTYESSVKNNVLIKTFSQAIR